MAERTVPGEHGFRYFPSFYWHVFDTMQRIRLLDDRVEPSARRFQTVLENLVSINEVTLALSRATPGSRGRRTRTSKKQTNPKLSRRPPRSFQEVFDAFRAFFGDLGHEPSDVVQLALKLTRFATSGALRRATYESMTFADFLEKDRLSKVCAADLDKAPEVLGGMRASEADARTQGNIALQLLLGDLRGTGVVDATLNGPTSSAWFLPWRDYLKSVHQVRFRRGTLTGFDVDEGADAKAPARIVPKVTWSVRDPKPAPDTHFVLALDLPPYLPKDTSYESPDRLDLCAAFLTAQAKLRDGAMEGVRPGDFDALKRWIDTAQWSWDACANPAAEAGPMRHLAGLQLFFRTNQQPTAGHTIYIDSEWRLSSIAQPPFWSVPRNRLSYLGLMSIDIGEWHTPDTSGNHRSAWSSSIGDIQTSVWRQVKETLGQKPEEPAFFHLDHGIELADPRAPTERERKPKRNRTPYLITRPEDWPLRPGDPAGYSVAGRWVDDKLVGGGWVVAGTFMKTFTRLTTMESANESARHAVNALLREIAPDAPLCEVRNLETEELADLRPLKDLDDKLFQEGLPHMMDTLRTDEWARALLTQTPACESGTERGQS